MAKKKIVVVERKTLRDHARTLNDTVAPHVGSARDKAAPALRDARDRAVPVLVAAAAATGPALRDARGKAAPYVADARDKAAPVLASARGRAAPLVASALDRTSPAREKAAPLVEEARDRFTSNVMPLLTAALTALDEATGDARSEAGKRGRALTKAFRTEVAPPPKQKLKVRDMLVSAGLGGVVFAVVKKVTSGSQATTAWQSSYTPPASSASGTSGTTGGTHRAHTGADTGTGTADTGTDTGTGTGAGTGVDVGAADPTEAAADSIVTPHDMTTPSRPASEVDVDPTGRP